MKRTKKLPSRKAKPLPLPAQEIAFHPSWHEILDQAGHILYAGPLSYTAPVSSIDPMIS